MQRKIKHNIQQAYDHLQTLLCDEQCLQSTESAIEWMTHAIKAGKKILLCGNGGSAADAQHFAGELIGQFFHRRAPLPALALTTDTSVLTCVANDFSYDEIFQRQVLALGGKGDILFGISTSGSSSNVKLAFEAAHSKEMKTILLTGKKQGTIQSLSDLTISVPSAITPRIQEMHLLIEHTIAENIEQAFVEGE